MMNCVNTAETPLTDTGKSAKTLKKCMKWLNNFNWGFDMIHWWNIHNKIKCVTGCNMWLLVILRSPADHHKSTMLHIYNNFNLTPVQQHGIDYVMQHFQEFCAPICNFWTARFEVFKGLPEAWRDNWYIVNRILQICNQCKFSDPDERLIDTIIFGMSIVRAQDKLLQTPKLWIYSSV